MKKLLPLTALALSVTLSACNTSQPPIDPTPEPVTQITGHVASGTGTGTVTLKGSTGQPLSTASVDTAGNFTLTLPGSADLAPELVTAQQALAQVGCEGTLNSTAAGAKGFGVLGLTLHRNNATVGLLPLDATINRFLGFPTGGTFDGRVWLYTDQPTKLTGSLDCTRVVNAGIPITIDVNATTVTGWNLLRLSGNATGSLSGISVNGTLVNTSTPWTEWKTLTELQAILKL